MVVKMEEHLTEHKDGGDILSCYSRKHTVVNNKINGG